MLVVVAYPIFLALAASVSAAPSRQDRFDAVDPFDVRPSFPYAAAYAGAGFPFMNPWVPFFPPFQVPKFQWPTFEIPVIKPWYEGPNVCQTKKTFDAPDEVNQWMNEGFPENGNFQHESQQCRSNNEKYVCMSRTQTPEGLKMELTKWTCCFGFVRPNDGRPGCVEIDLRYLTPTLRNMGASKIISIAESVGMADDFYNNNYTVFCPPNSVLEAIQKELDDDIENDVNVKLSHQKLKKKTRLYNMLTSHLSPGFFKSDDLIDGSILPTDNPVGQIRINVYFSPMKIVTANCVPILSADHFARNGIIHVVEKNIPVPAKTVADIIAGDTQFSILKKMLSTAGLVQTLRNPNGSYTLFAPTDSALKPQLASMTGETDNRCTVSVMKHHIIEHVICSSALLHHARSMNMIGELLSLSRDQNNKLYVDDVQVVVRDIMATNGVVHIIDGMLSTRQTKPLSQVLDESGLYEFLALLEKANLKFEFDSLENVTFFIPADEVIQSIPPRHLDALLNYNQSIQDVLWYHVVDGQAELSKPDQVLKSKLKNSTLKFQVHTKHPQLAPQVIVQCANVLSADIKLCGGTLHVVDKLLLPPKLSIIDFLESVEGFSTLVLLLRATGMDRRLRAKEAAFTLFAPTDDAFHELGENIIFRILEDVEKTTDLVKMHILLGTVCCNQLNNDLLSGRRQARTMDGSLLRLDRTIDGTLMVGGAHVVECDIVATNGVIHMVDAVLSHDQTSFQGGNLLDSLFILG